jgi:hypothetical protein
VPGSAPAQKDLITRLQADTRERGKGAERAPLRQSARGIVSVGRDMEASPGGAGQARAGDRAGKRKKRTA